MSILCGHCGVPHETVGEVRACAGLHPTADEGTEARLHCGSEMIPIVYGYPSFDMQEAAVKGSMRLGGCMVGAHDPSWYCPKCGHYGFDVGGQRVGGLANVRMTGRGVELPARVHLSRWTKAKMWLQRRTEDARPVTGG